MENFPSLSSQSCTLFPSMYFDNNRKLSKEIGFRFTKQKYRSEQNRKKAQAIKKKQNFTEAQQRQYAIKKQQKIDRALKKFFNGTYSHTQLDNYFSKNLGQDYTQLPTLKKEFNNKKQQHGTLEKRIKEKRII